MSAEWENFVASLDPSVLERERFRVLGPLDHERPGSRWDHEMRARHVWLKHERIMNAAVSKDAVQVADADTFTAAHGGRVLVPRSRSSQVSDEELDKRFAAYRAAQKRKAA